MKIFLTGGSSFIGKSILEQLNDKYVIVAPRSVDLDLTDSEAVLEFLRLQKPDMIIHAANIGGKRNQLEKNDTAEKNLRMFFNLVRGKEYFNRMIALGSGAEYDKSRSIINITEAEFDEYIPIDQYGFSKYVMAKYAEKVDYITHLRLFGVYGKYEDYTIRFISNSICRALYDLPLEINQNTRFDYLLVNDLVRILNLFINNKPTHKFYNIASGVGVELTSIAGIINELMSKKLPISCRTIGMNNEYTCSIDRFNNEFPEFELSDFRQSVGSLIMYYQNKQESIDRNELLTD